MHSFLAFNALAVLISAAIAASAPTDAIRDISLLARGRIHQDLASPFSPKPETKLFNDVVSFHIKAIEPDLDQEFDEWKVDMASEYWYRRTEFFHGQGGYGYRTIDDVDKNIRSLSQDAAARIALWKEAKHGDLSQGSSYSLDLYLIWITKRLSLLQNDVRLEVYKLMVEWSIALHGACKIKYTPYPAGIGAIMAQIQTIGDVREEGDTVPTCWYARYIKYNDQFLALHDALSKPLNFSNLQRLCDAALKGCGFAVEDLELDFKPS